MECHAGSLHSQVRMYDDKVPRDFITDDRANVVERTMRLSPFARGAHTLSSHQQALLRKLYRQSYPRHDRLIRVRLWIGAGVCYLALTYANLHGWHRAIGGALGGIGCAFFIRALLHHRLLPSLAPARVVPLLIRMDQCPACCQSLRGLPRAADDCVVCPECGAAWRPFSHVDWARESEFSPVS